MDNPIENYKERSLELCDRLINQLNMNKDDANSFFGGEIYKSYIVATERAIEKANNGRYKIRNK